MGYSRRLRTKLCCRLISDSIMRLFYFTPRWLVGVTPRTKRPKKNYSTEDINREETKTFLYFSFIPGFNNHSMGEGIFPEYNWNG